MEGLEHRDAVPEEREIARHGDPRRPRADYRDPLAVRRHDVGLLDVAARRLPVREVSLEPSDGDRLVLLPEDAELLALLLLRADPAADRREGVALLDLPDPAGQIVLEDALDEAGDVDADGAPLDAAGFLARQAAGGLFAGQLGRVSEGHLVEVPDPLERLLLRHRQLFRDDLLARHGVPPSSQ